MTILKSKATKVLGEISRETDGISLYELGKKLNDKYSETLSFTNFEEFININIISGRLEQKEEKLYITERGKKAIEV
ncbi:hypothetical protein ACIQAA_27125 [Neobacillus sp. NPDC093182]|jgi:hypothetical protein|uniref:hypothetical protein n=1 Tax=Neobacillus sp. NPDC093182 TaxID=3364297 RepID=UPI0037F2098D